MALSLAPAARRPPVDRVDFADTVAGSGDRLLAVARRFFPDGDEARDALHDAMLAGYRARGSFAGDARLTTWLHRIVVNACLMRLRARRRRRETAAGDTLAPLVDRHGGVASTEDAVAATEVRALVRRAVAALPAPHRVVVELHDLGEHDTADVAAALGISPAAVRSRLHRARRELRAALAPVRATGGRRGTIASSRAPRRRAEGRLSEVGP
jgi:RNA polymerase sigma-70 factor (ECF subfamily)